MSAGLAMELTEEQRAMLSEIALRPNGTMVRGQAEKQVVLDLCSLQLVCDPHEMGHALFTRITDAGRAALAGGRS